MKSEFADRETLGTMIEKTREQHAKSSPIEAGDLAHEGGKSYMKQLIDIVEDHRYAITEYYIQVFCQKELYAKDRTIYFRFFARKSKPLMEDDTDCWYVHNKKEILRLEWSLPHVSDFDRILRDPSSDKDLVRWIKMYKDAQSIRTK